MLGEFEYTILEFKVSIKIVYWTVVYIVLKHIKTDTRLKDIKKFSILNKNNLYTCNLAEKVEKKYANRYM